MLNNLAPLPDQFLSQTYNTFLTPLLTLFSNTLSSLTFLIKRSLHKYTFLALSSYEAQSALQPRSEQILKKRGAEVRRESNELKEGLNSLKGVCLRSFPEFLADIKMAGLPKSGPPTLDIGTGIDFTLTVSQGLSVF